jgi:sorbitol/mannitol transport system permease protein
MATVTDTSKFGKLIWPALAWSVALIFFFPIFWMVFTSFKTDADAVKPEFLFIFTPTLENYVNMAQNYDYWRFAINSVITSTFATAFALVVGIPAAYAMAFDPSRRTKDILVWMLSTKMMPAVGALVPIYVLAQTAGLLDTRLALIIVFTLSNLPIMVWMLYSNYKDIPPDILEAARMDGAGPMRFFKDVLLPLSTTSIAAKPCSRNVGTSGSRMLRPLPVTAMALSRPPWTCVRTEGTEANINWTWPPIKSVIAPAMPR